MPIRTSWYFEPRIVLQVYEGDVTLEDIQECAAELTQLMMGKEAVVYTIQDLSACDRVPADIRGISRLATHNNPMFGPMVVFGQDVITRIITNSVMRVTGIAVYSVSNMDAALDFIRERDPELAYLLDQR
ncbi:MAG: hypothetical protein KJ064_04250 [Anaerolineae bacterium]|nr:hypothetical protein [Anaerolineae bacterium]